MLGRQLQEEKELKKDGRGATDMKIIDNGGVCVVRWIGNGIAILASSFSGKNEVNQVRRWCKSAKKHFKADRSTCVSMYNEYIEVLTIIIV